MVVWSCRNVWKAPRSESQVKREYHSISKARENLWGIMILLCLPSLPKYSGIFSIIKVSKGKSQKEGGRENHLGLRERNMLSDFREGRKRSVSKVLFSKQSQANRIYVFSCAFHHGHSRSGPSVALSILTTSLWAHSAHMLSSFIVGKSKSHGSEGNDPAVNSNFTLRARLHLLFIIFSNWKRPLTKEKNGKTMTEKYKPSGWDI